MAVFRKKHGVSMFSAVGALELRSFDAYSAEVRMLGVVGVGARASGQG
jgi:hypothetical protein